MLIKKPKTSYTGVKRIFKGFLLLEVTIVISSYYVWKRMNTSQDFRHYMSENWPRVLEGYYSVGETISSENKRIRQFDQDTWKKEVN